MAVPMSNAGSSRRLISFPIHVRWLVVVVIAYFSFETPDRYDSPIPVAPCIVGAGEDVDVGMGPLWLPVRAHHHIYSPYSPGIAPRISSFVVPLMEHGIFEMYWPLWPPVRATSSQIRQQCPMAQRLLLQEPVQRLVQR